MAKNPHDIKPSTIHALVVAPIGPFCASPTQRMESDEKVASSDSPLEYHLQKYLLLLATLVAAVTYAAGFNAPGGVWEDNSQGYLAGEPIIRTRDYNRYLVFYYSNATSFATSIVLIILILILAIIHERKLSSCGGKGNDQDEKKHFWLLVLPLRLVMVLDLLGLMVAYAAGTGRDTVTWVMVALIFVCVLLHMLLAASWPQEGHSDDSAAELQRRDHKVLMLLATFVISITYMSGLSPPGGFWGGNDIGHRAGDPILQEHHPRRLRAFFFCNTVAFAASLLIIMLLLDRKMRKTGLIRCRVLYGYITISLAGLGGAYTVGSCREMGITIYVVGLVGAFLACICIQRTLYYRHQSSAEEKSRPSREGGGGMTESEKSANESGPTPTSQDGAQQGNNAEESNDLEKAYSLVLLLATLVATVTYQAALVPPGGAWQDNRDGHKAGDPILLSTNPRRYKVFFYCNSTAFVAALVIILLVKCKSLLKHHVLERAMILGLFGLMGAYAAGSCRDIATSIYVIALAGAVLVYVVIHVVFFARGDIGGGEGEEEAVDKRRKRLLLFAVLGITLTYQAGLTPPRGFYLGVDEFWHPASDPILFHNYPRRYRAFYYCNSVSFMSSIALILLLANSNLYRPAIRSYALSVCAAAGLFGLMGAYSAGSTQHLKTSIYVFVLVALVLSLVIILLVIYQRKANDTPDPDPEMAAKTNDQKGEAKDHAERKYLMLLGVLAASVTYQAGLNPPGGVWQGNSNGHAAGDPVMQDNRKHQYLAFFYSNSISFAASVLVIVLLLPKLLRKCKWLLKVMDAIIVLDFLSLLVAYASGCTMEWETFGHITALIIPAMVLATIYMLPSFKQKSPNLSDSSSPVQRNEVQNVSTCSTPSAMH